MVVVANDEITVALLNQPGSSQTGSEVNFCCPYPEKHNHGDRNPSAYWNVSKGVWNCKACGEKGHATQRMFRAELKLNSYRYFLRCSQ